MSKRPCADSPSQAAKRPREEGSAAPASAPAPNHSLLSNLIALGRHLSQQQQQQQPFSPPADPPEYPLILHPEHSQLMPLSPPQPSPLPLPPPPPPLLRPSYSSALEQFRDALERCEALCQGTQ